MALFQRLLFLITAFKLAVRHCKTLLDFLGIDFFHLENGNTDTVYFEEFCFKILNTQQTVKC